jgi:hypothetical protein
MPRAASRDDEKGATTRGGFAERVVRGPRPPGPEFGRAFSASRKTLGPEEFPVSGGLSPEQSPRPLVAERSRRALGRSRTLTALDGRKPQRPDSICRWTPRRQGPRGHCDEGRAASANPGRWIHVQTCRSLQEQIRAGLIVERT